MSLSPATFALEGGLDLVTPEVKLPPGRVISALNYEPTASGYTRLRGFERFDGKTAPSDVAHFAVFHFQNLTITPAIGGSFGGSTSLARDFRVATAPVITSGALGGVNTGYIGGYWGEIDHYTAGENIRLNSAGAVIAQCVGGDPILDEAVPEAEADDWLSLAREMVRGRIAAVPGSGPVRGINYIAGQVVAVRDNGGATNGVLYRAQNGWGPVELSKTYTFNSGGVVEVKPNFDVRDGGNIGTVTAVTLASGTWAGGDAAGTITVFFAGAYPASGTHLDYDDGALHADNLTLADGGTAYALPDGGAYEFCNYNFYGANNLRRTYGVNGVGPAFQYDPATLALSPIYTGSSLDTPTHLAPHRMALFLSFAGGSVQGSQPGEPTAFDGSLGAVEIGAGSEVTALIPANSGTLAVLTENSVSVLYGSDASNYQLDELNDTAGALAKTAQRLGQVIYMDNTGLRGLATSQQFGNFNIGTLSRMAAPIFAEYRRLGIDPVASWVSRRKGQYWAIFADGSGVVVCLEKKNPEVLTIDLGFTPTCANSVEDQGVERVFIGDANGYIYEFDKGTSFDGAAIPHELRLPYFAFGDETVDKSLNRMVVNFETQGGAPTLAASVSLDNGAEESGAQDLIVTLGAARTANGNRRGTAETHFDGFAKNVSIKFSGNTANEEPHVLQTVSCFLVVAQTNA